ncbi:hypothetical protein IJX73_01605 [bacterium]|nr:hypothetical protein [bacterium]MBQ9149605.1 hypothetical protein [bacterium]
MKLKGIICFVIMALCVSIVNPAEAYYKTKKSVSQPLRNYDYIYMNPIPQKMYAYGRYIGISSGIRYSHSPSKLKRARQAARINAYNRAAYGYYY